MNTIKHVVVSHDDLVEWISELSTEEKESFGDGSPLEIYVNWCACLGWKMISMCHTRGPGLGVPTWHMMMSGELNGGPYPTHKFKPAAWWSEENSAERRN